MDYSHIKKTALETISLEKNAIGNLANAINDQFIEAIKILHQSKGRVIISGIGKSAIIAQKIVATMNSTGSPALFMHAADAIHGDLGMLQSDDVVIIISKSGESAEIKVLIPLIKNFGNPLIALCGNTKSYLAANADYTIDVSVDAEACPNNLAPTTSTTAQLVMGDAIAISLLNAKGFTAADFAKYHPGGTLGKQLYLKVISLCNNNQKPIVYSDDSIKKVIVEITSKRLGATVVLNKKEAICGIITDGDIRRMLEKYTDINTLLASDIMNANPKMIDAESLATEALALMQTNSISQLIVSTNQKYVGLIHLHDLIKEGIL